MGLEVGDDADTGIDVSGQPSQAHSAQPAKISQQQIGGAVSKLVSASIGDIAVVFSRSPRHKHFSLADIEWLILPAVVTGQAYVAELQHKEHGGRAPVAAVLWASVSDEIDQRLLANPGQQIKLRPDEWKSGDHIWIVDVAGDPRTITDALARLAASLFKDGVAKLTVPTADGTTTVNNLHDLPSNSPIGASE